jgi:Na+-driven multidrug efflux pump
MNSQLIDILKLAWPLIVIQLGLQIYTLIDVFRKSKTKSLNTTAWVIIIIIGEILGPIAYLIFGRSED